MQVFILDSLARYEAENAKDAESVIERVLPRLQHANCAVVLSAVKVQHPEKNNFKRSLRYHTCCQEHTGLAGLLDRNRLCSTDNAQGVFQRIIVPKFKHILEPFIALEGYFWLL